jgi:hypothetical protein
MLHKQLPEISAGKCMVPKRGTATSVYLRHILENIACFTWRCSKAALDGTESRRYAFDYAMMTRIELIWR